MPTIFPKRGLYVRLTLKSSQGIRSTTRNFVTRDKNKDRGSLLLSFGCRPTGKIIDKDCKSKGKHADQCQPDNYSRIKCLEISYNLPFIVETQGLTGTICTRLKSSSSKIHSNSTSS